MELLCTSSYVTAAAAEAVLKANTPVCGAAGRSLVLYCTSSGQRGYRDKRKRNCRGSSGDEPLTSANGDASTHPKTRK